jgi:cytochrome P450
MATQSVLFGPAFYDDPYPFYRQLRETDPVHQDTRMGWLVTRYADIKALALDHRLSRGRFEDRRVDGVPEEAQSAARPILDELRREMLRSDPPQHTRLRKLVVHAFTPRMIEQLRPRIQAIVDGLLDAVAAAGEMDFIRDFAQPLPATVIMELLGVPHEDQEWLKVYTADRVTFLGAVRTAADPLAIAHRAAESVHTLDGYFRTLIGQRRIEPGDDLISALVAIEAEGSDRLSEEELVANCMLLLTAGHETTTNLLGNGLLALLRHPDQMRRVQEDVDLISSAVEEFLRYDASVQLAPRVTVAAIELVGKVMQPGEPVMLVLGAANRDPEHFVDPDQLDITRRPNDHLTFGFDRHFCLGTHLARLEAQIAFTTLLYRFPTLEQRGGPVMWHANPAYRGVEGLPISWS